MSVVACQAVSNLLQEHWSLNSLSKAQIDWLTTRFDVVAWLKNLKSNNVVVGCYGASGQEERISATATKTSDPVQVDVIVKGQGSLQANVTLRNTVYNYIKTLIVDNSSGAKTDGVDIVTSARNSSPVEIPEYARRVLTVNCQYLEGT